MKTGQTDSKLDEFLPGALLIQAQPPSKTLRLTALAIISLLTFAAIWAYLGQVDIVARAEGKIIPTGQVKQIQAFERGVISKIRVSDGQQVSAGEILVELNSTALTAEQNVLNERLNFINDALLRLELFTQFIETQQKPTRHDLVQQNDLLDKQMSAYQAQYDLLIAQYRAAKEQVAISQAELAKFSALEPIVREQTDAAASLFKKGLEAKTQFLTLKQAFLEVTTAKKTSALQVKHALQSLESIQRQIEALSADTQANTLDQRLSLTEEKHAIKGQLIGIETQLARHQLRSPIDGRVTQLSIFTEGGIVTAAHTLMTIVPLDQQLRVEAWLANKDIGFIKTGQTAEVKVHAFPFTKYGVIDAQVTKVSADATENSEGSLTYKAEFELASDHIQINGTPTLLSSGMSVSAELKTGKRKIIEYLLSPLLRMKADAIEER